MNFEINLSDLFEGPMDLLLYLIRKQEMDICAVSLKTITRQYLSFLEVLEFIDYNAVTDFLDVASQLLEIKSQQFLPGKEPIEEPVVETKQDFVANLLEYQKYRDAAAELEEKRLNMQENFSRISNDLPTRVNNIAEAPIQRVELWDLVSAFGRIVRESQANSIKVSKKEKSIKEYMLRIQDRLISDGSTTFTDLFIPNMQRSELIGTFLGTMELIRHFGVEARQYQLFGEIWITRGQNWTEKIDLSQFDNYESQSGSVA